MLSKEYDLNLYGSDKHTMRFTAYRLYRDFEGNLSTDYDKKFYTLILTRADDSGIIRYLVNNDAFYDMHLVDDYTDFDEWYDFVELNSWDFMPKIREWLDNLPEYRMVDQREYKGE